MSGVCHVLSCLMNTNTLTFKVMDIFDIFQSKDGTTHHGQSPKPKSDGLLVHVHGGGFVAQSSKSHEVQHMLY